MAKSTLSYPQFFHTLVPGFHTHLMIPLDFFSKYVQGKNVEDTVEVKSDSSDITWKVKMTGSRLIDGWKEFAVGNNLQTGDVLLVRYVGDLVLHVSNLGPECSQTPDNKNDIQDVIGKTLLKKRLSFGTQAEDGEEEDNMEFPRKKRVKMNSPDPEAGSSSSFDNSSFVANVTASSLCTDIVYLPEYLSEASGRESLSVVKEENIIGGERSEEEFNSMGSLVEVESSKEKCSSMEPLLETEKTKYNLKRRVISYSSYLPGRKEFVTFTLPPDYVIIFDRLRLPMRFTRENSIDKPGNIYLVGKGGKKCRTKLLRNKKGAMSLGKGWKYFVEVNNIMMGFTLKLLWKDTTPVLCLCDAEFNIDREQEKSVFIDSSKNPLVTLTITPSIIRDGRLRLPKDFMMENDINKPGMITLMGQDGSKQQIKLLFDKSSESMALGGGLKTFVKENGIKIGDSFTLELIWEDTTPVLRLCSVEHSIDERGGCSETNQKKSLPMEPSSCKKISKDENIEEKSQRERDSTPSSKKQFVTLKTTPSSYTKCRLIIPMQFVNENKITKPGMMYLVGKDGRKWPTDLRRDTKGTIALGHGWRKFGEAHGIKVGESFTMELIREGAIPLLRWVHTEPNSSKGNEKESVSKEPRGRDLSSTIRNKFVTLAPTPEDVSACQLYLTTPLKKGLSLGTQVDDGEEEDNMEFPRKKRVRMNSPDAEAHSSSSLDNSSFVANVTALSLCTDTLYFPEYFTSSNGLTRKCSKIVLVDGGERSWALDLSFDNSSDTFYISKGWRNFCDENGQEAGGFFQFKLVGSGETPVLSFCPTEPLSDRKLRDCSVASGRESLFIEVSSKGKNIIGAERSEDEFNSMGSLLEIESSEDKCSSMEQLLETEKTKYSSKRRVISYSSYLSCRKEFVTFTLPPDYIIIIDKLSLPMPFTRENGIDKPGEIYLVGKGGKKCRTKLLRSKRGAMSLGKGWKYFVKENDIKIGFTLKLLWKDTTPVLCLCDAEFNIDREQENSVFIDSSENQLVTLTITSSIIRNGSLRLPKDFTMENDINKPGMITLMGKDGLKQQIKLLFDKSSESMVLGCGLKSFVKENGIIIGDSFTLKLIWEDTTPVLRLCNVEHSIDERGGCSETNQKKSLPMDENIEEKSQRGRDSTPSSTKQFVTLKTTPSSYRKCRLIIPVQFANENKINKPGMMYLVGKDGRKWPTDLRRDTKGTIALGHGWREFGEAHDLKLGESFTMELIREGATPLLRWVHTERNSSKANEKVSVSIEPRGSSSTAQNKFVTLAPTPEDISACQLYLATQFMKANGINRLGKITILGENGKEWFGYLLSKDGLVALGIGWDEFCEANGVKSGESFTLEFTNVHDKTSPVLKLCSPVTKKD